jgi:hypothetical protein
MMKKYMIDSSVWIAYFRDKNYKLTPFIKELIGKPGCSKNPTFVLTVNPGPDIFSCVSG